MKTIKTVHLTRLRQEEAFGFHQLVITEFEKCTDTNLSEVLLKYKESYLRFNETLAPTRTKLETKSLLDLDHERDNAYHGLAAHLRSVLRHGSNLDKIKSAEIIKDVMDKYGDPTEMPYTQENGVLNNLLQDLSTPELVKALELVKATDWVNDIKEPHTEFIKLFSDRSLINSSVETGASKEARRKVDNAYHACVVRFNAIVELTGRNTYDAVADAVNEHINYQKTVIAIRQTNYANAKKKQEAAI